MRWRRVPLGHRPSQDHKPSSPPSRIAYLQRYRLRTRSAGCAPASANRFLTWCDPQPRTPSSELVTLNSKRRHGSGGSDDAARRDQLKLDVPVKQDGPVDGQVQLLSDRQRPVGSEALTGAGHADSATRPLLIWPTTARDAVPN